jgi:transposase
MDAERTVTDCPRCPELEQRVAELEAMVRSLSDQVAKLTAALEEERRRGKRQAAPFSKGAPMAEPKQPGRKRGKRHGPHAQRSVPPRIDETIDVPLPKMCPHCASEQVSETHVGVQYQTEIPAR